MAKKATSPYKKKTEAAPAQSSANKWLAFLKDLRHKRTAKFALLWTIPFLVLMSSFFSEVLKNFNYLEVLPRELILPTFMHATTALLIALAVYFVKRPRNYGAKVVVALLLGLLMIDYGSRLNAVMEQFRAVLPILPDAPDDIPFISLAFLLVLFGLAVLLGSLFERLQRRYDQLKASNIAAGVAIVVGFLFFGQAIRMIQVLPPILTQSRVQPQALEGGEPDKQADKPDIYYLVFDRYTNSKVLKDQLGFDNSSFVSFLNKNKFYVKDEAYANYPYTSLSVASTLNARYLDDITAPYKDEEVQSRMLYHNLIYQSSVVKALQEQGYEYHSIGSNYTATSRAPLAAADYSRERILKILGREKRVRGVEGTQLAQSPFYHFLQNNSLSWLGVGMQETVGENYIRMQLDTLEDLAKSEEQGGRFIFAHILLPHPPYLFNADGSEAPFQGYNNQGKLAKDKYLEQLQFTNSQIEQTINAIREKSGGEAVVILNADEGPYPDVMLSSFLDPGSTTAGREAVVDDDMRKWPDEWLRMKFGVLQAVHIPKATSKDMTNMSSVNAFRIVLNRYFGYNLEYLPNCNFGLTKGRHFEFNYTDITDRFTDSARVEECAEE